MGGFEGCLRREHWLAREPGTAEPLWLNRHKNILPELKKIGLQNGAGKFGPQSAPAWQRRRAALPAAFASGLGARQSRNRDTAERRTRWCERRICDRKCTAVVCGFQKPPQCLQAERGRGNVSMDNWRAEPSTGVRLVNQSVHIALAHSFKCCYRDSNLYPYSGKDYYVLVCEKNCCPLAMQNSAQCVLWKA